MKTVLAAILVVIALPVCAADRPSGLTPQQVEGLLSGRGMGLSMPAEMNGKPGPLHVLEHADSLGLTEAQRRAASELVAAMKAEAIPLGEALVAREVNLDALFAVPLTDQSAARVVVEEIAALNGRLRWVHLQAHLDMTVLLSSDQAARYGHLRHH